MSRARQVANFDPALFAADEVSGDKVSGGTIGAGVIGASVTGGAGLSGMTALGTVASGVIGASVTGGAGLTGSTSLGTVTVGDISHADIVYPDDHVVYMNSSHTSSSGTITIDYNWNNATNCFLTVPAAICNVLSSLIISMSYQTLVYQGSSHHFANTRIARTAPGSVVQIGIPQYSGHNGTGLGASYPIYDNCSNCVRDTSLSNADHTYYLQGSAYSVYCSQMWPAAQGCNIVIWGIK